MAFNSQIQITYSANRRSISISVHRDLSIKVRAPLGISKNKIDEIINVKSNWIGKKIEHFQQNLHKQSKPKEYVNGEIFNYLGAEYQIEVNKSKVSAVEIIGDKIRVNFGRASVKNIIIKWLSQQANDIFNQRLLVNFEIFSQLYQYKFPVLKIRKMKTRWGSMSTKGIMTLSVNLIHAPIECIDYVIMHELCHLRWHNHGKRFHQLQEKLTPNWKAVKIKLECFIE